MTKTRLKTCARDKQRKVQMKTLNVVRTAVILMAVSILSSCSSKPEYHQITGVTFGVVGYHITVEGKIPDDLQTQIEAVLDRVNESMSTYVPTSVISQVNKSAKPCWVDHHFKKVFAEAKHVFKTTNGTFDPTVGPLMRLWGFRGKAGTVDSSQVDSIMPFIGFDMVKLEGDSVYKEKPEIQLDFGAIAKGYGVDLVAELLDKLQIENYLVEIGGEVTGKGVNSRNQPWTLKILQPDTAKNATEGFALTKLSNESMATSGNYKQYKMVDGKMRVHTINPSTGYGSMHNLLSATVFAQTCIKADALATACMVMGLDKSIEMDLVNNDFSLFLIYQDEEGKLNFYQSKAKSESVKISL